MTPLPCGWRRYRAHGGGNEGVQWRASQGTVLPGAWLAAATDGGAVRHPFRKSRTVKNDRNDAEAIATAVRQGNMRFVLIKSVE